MRNGRTGAAPLLTVSGLSLSYGRLRALDDIDLSVRSGELVALAGENGAGKTTLVRCIAGDVVPASGEIYLGGKRVPPDPGGAARLGVAVVWQDLALCDNLDIAANIMLGQEPKRSCGQTAPRRRPDSQDAHDRLWRHHRSGPSLPRPAPAADAGPATGRPAPRPTPGRADRLTVSG